MFGEHHEKYRKKLVVKRFVTILKIKQCFFVSPNSENAVFGNCSFTVLLVWWGFFQSKNGVVV
jgi:hypothetical protein